MKKSFNKKIAISIAVGTVVGLSFSLAIVFSKTAIHGKFPQGTFVANINISDKTTEESLYILSQKEEKFYNTSFELNLFNKTISLKPEEIGVNVLLEETIKTIEQTDAKEIGLVDLFKSDLHTESKLNVITQIEYEKLINKIEKEFYTKDLEPKSATFYFNEKGKLDIQEESPGIIINTEALFDEIKLAASSLETKTINIKTIDKDADITKEKLNEQIEEIKTQLNKTITLIDPIYSDDWYLNISKNLDWINFVEKERIQIPYTGNKVTIDSLIEGVEGETFIALEIKEEKLNEYIDKNISKWLDRDVEDVNIYINEEGEIVAEGKGSPGKKVQRELFKEALELAIVSNIDEIIIPVIDIEPEIVIAQELQDLGVKEKIAIGHTSYYNSPGNRIHNIKTGASKFNGILIEPGEVFSFNTNLGAVNGYTGYKKEKVIKKEGTIPEYGGGLCQVSTTMYRAALLSGLPIVERNEHSYAVSYYSQILGHGLDATIYLGGSDLKFENNTENHVLIQTYVENDYELYIVFYGTDDGRKTELEGPFLSNYHRPGPTMYIDTSSLYVGETKQVEKPHTGFKAIWYRHLELADGSKLTEEIETNYQAVPAKIWVGTLEHEVPEF